MIIFLYSADNQVPLKRYFQEWGWPIRSCTKRLSYEKLVSPEKLADGTYIFCDVDRLDAGNVDIARNAYTELSRRGERVRLLNSPCDSLPRFALLRKLYALGINDFNVHLFDAPIDQIRFPVFIRSSTQHKGAFCERIETPEQLLVEKKRLLGEGYDPLDLIVVEYIETGLEGEYRKYAATRVGDRMIAHHIMFDRRWEVKGPSLDEPPMLEEEREYQLTNPHNDLLMRAFDIANIQYGRIDYAMLEGRMQVWEINTNPTLLYPRDNYTAKQMPAKLWFAEQFNTALMAIDDKSTSTKPWWSGFLGLLK